LVSGTMNLAPSAFLDLDDVRCAVILDRTHAADGLARYRDHREIDQIRKIEFVFLKVRQDLPGKQTGQCHAAARPKSDP